MWRHRSRALFVLLPGVLVLSACGSDDSPTDTGDPLAEQEAELTTLIRSTLTLEPIADTVPYPPDNHPGEAGYAERVELGRLLFFDPILSGDDDISCAHCHHPALAWGDGRALSVGVGGDGLGPDRERGLPRNATELSEWEFITPRNSPTILDVGRLKPFEDGDGPWDGRMFWDGRTSGLEAQARAPVRSRDEMRGDAYDVHSALNQVLTDLMAIPEYQQRFEAAFPGELEPPGWETPPGTEADYIYANTYARAIAAYERELFGVDAPYDDFVRGDDGALTFEQKKGLLLFHEKDCVSCHAGPTFSDFEFRTLGVKQGGPGKPPIHERGDGTDVGRYNATQATQADESNRWAFRTPSLRNVALTAPYFHTGGVGTDGDADYQTLRQVVEFYVRGGNDEGLPMDHVDPFLQEPLALEDDEVDALVAFLESLTASRIGSSWVDPTVPPSVPSELEPPVVLPPVLEN